MVGWNKMKDPQLHRYRNGHVYLVDDRAVDAIGDTNDPQLARHAANCDLVRGLFNKNNYEVHSVQFPGSASQQEFWDYWREEIDGKVKDELMIIYFDGSAANSDTNYSWKFAGGPDGWINAYDLFQMVNRGKANALFILDCDIPTRFQNKLRPVNDSSMEIIARGGRQLDENGIPIDDDGDFTKAMMRDLDEFVTKIDDKFRNYRTLRSIPELMARDGTIVSNPMRIWLTRTKFKGTRIVNRIKISPAATRGTGELVIVRERIQGPGETKYTKPQQQMIAHELKKKQEITKAVRKELQALKKRDQMRKKQIISLKKELEEMQAMVNPAVQRNSSQDQPRDENVDEEMEDAVSNITSDVQDEQNDEAVDVEMHGALVDAEETSSDLFCSENED